MSAAFEVKDVVKHYGDTKALDGVSLKAEEGKIFTLLGPNGAGKTTLIKLLSTLITPDKGSAKVLGVDVLSRANEVRRLIGLAGQFAAIDEYLTGRENIYMVGRLYHIPSNIVKKRAQQLLDELGLSDAADRLVKTYSGGMRRRLDLGASLVGKPKILFLDEPTTGLDPKTRQDLWQIIRDLVKEGTSIVLTTQYLEEADELSDHIAVIDRGKVIAEGTSRQLKQQFGGDVLEISTKDEADKEKVLEIVKGISSRNPAVENLTLHIPVSSGAKKLLELVRKLDEEEIVPVTLSQHQPSLDDVFLELIGEKASSVAKQPKQKKGKW